MRGFIIIIIFVFSIGFSANSSVKIEFGAVAGFNMLYKQKPEKKKSKKEKGIRRRKNANKS